MDFAECVECVKVLCIFLRQNFVTYVSEFVGSRMTHDQAIIIKVIGNASSFRRPAQSLRDTYVM